MNKYNKLNKVYGRAQQAVESFDKRNIKCLQGIVIDEK